MPFTNIDQVVAFEATRGDIHQAAVLAIEQAKLHRGHSRYVWLIFNDLAFRVHDYDEPSKIVERYRAKLPTGEG